MINNVEIKSVLRNLTSNLDSYTNLNDLKSYLLNNVNNSSINLKDKCKMVKDISICNTKDKLIKYVWNALLKYEGCGVIKESLNGGSIN